MYRTLKCWLRILYTERNEYIYSDACGFKQQIIWINILLVLIKLFKST